MLYVLLSIMAVFVIVDAIMIHNNLKEELFQQEQKRKENNNG